MGTKIVLGAGIFVLLIVVTLLVFNIHLGKNINFLYTDGDTDQTRIVMATATYIRNNYTPGGAVLSDNEWLEPGEKLNKKMIIMTAEGFQIKGSKWIFLRMKDMYIGIHDKGNNDFVAIAMLEKKNDDWVIFNYFLVNRYNSGWIPLGLRKKAKNKEINATKGTLGDKL